MNSPDVGLDTLLDLGGSILEQEGGYRIKIEVRRIPPSVDAQHGIRYSLSLHDKYGTRVLGRSSHQGSTPMKTIVIGVMSQEPIRARAISIARGEYKPKAGEPKAGEPRIWFTSMKSVAEVLSDQNRALLKVIRQPADCA